MILNAREMRRYLHDEDFPQSPLYRGFGTHFTYAWVGTPSKRVSLIVDTGSHYTAFPCKSCTNCGKHTDSYWDPLASSSSLILKCNNGQKCLFSQRYTEGSSWSAYKVRDLFALGGEEYSMLTKPQQWSVNFTFGCQTSETGLFRTQMENGIMGMSADPNTLPYVLYDQNRVSSTIFSLCLLQTGGVMSIGSINLNLHLKPLQYATLTRKAGYFTIHVETIFFKRSLSHRTSTSSQEGEVYTTRDLNEPKTKYNSGKGIIIDSGTTDTFLPSSIAGKFKEIFREMTGVAFTNSPITLTTEQLHSFPTIVYRLQAKHSSMNTSVEQKYVEIEFPPQHYLEPVSGQKGKYIPRLYLTERNGGVIGANMMTGYDIVFDQMNLRVGFAKSHCKIQGERLYDGVTKPVKITRHLEEHQDQRRLADIKVVSSLPSNGGALVGVGVIPAQASAQELHRFVQTAPFEDCRVRPLGPCSALCQRYFLPSPSPSLSPRGPSRALGRSRTISPALRHNIRHYRQMVSHPIRSNPPPVFGYYSEGYQRHLMNESCLQSHYLSARSVNKTLLPSRSFIKSTGPTIEQFTACYVSCDPHSNPISYMNPKRREDKQEEDEEGRGRGEVSDRMNPFCANSSWSECDKDCKQTRPLTHLQVAKNSSGTYYECQAGGEGTLAGAAFEQRKCSKGKCLLNVHSECVYILQITLPLFDDRLWSTAWKHELVESMSQVLQVRVKLPSHLLTSSLSFSCPQIESSYIDIPLTPHEIAKAKMQLNFHIRVPVLGKDRPNFELQTAQIDSNLHEQKFSPERPLCSVPLVSGKEIITQQNLNLLLEMFLNQLYSLPSPVW
jgi:hypothetical protein